MGYRSFEVLLLFVSSLAVVTHGLAGIGETCSSSSDCMDRMICYEQDGKKCCFCPIGYKGDDCTEVDYVASFCPYPSNRPSTCSLPVSSSQPCGFDNSDCPNGGECCISSDGCGSQCISPATGCGNPINVKTCTDDDKICVNDGLKPDGFRCECIAGYTGTKCRTRSMIDKSCKYPSKAPDVCDAIERTCVSTDKCDDKKICCSTGCKTECVKKSRGLDPKLLILLLSLQSQRRVSPRRPPVRPRPPVCTVRVCGYILCPTNLRATCRPIAGGCDGNFFDQYTGRLITRSCHCPRGVTEDHTCNAFSCYDSNRRLLVCANYPQAKCRVSKCGGCTKRWNLDNGASVECGRELSSSAPVSSPNPSCLPNERYIPNCPRLCESVACPAYPSATCRVHACDGCRYKFELPGGEDVTARCYSNVG